MSNTSNTRSDSNESLSIYETPITSPLNQSLCDSTRIDSALFGTTSGNSQSMDLYDFQRPFDMRSVATDSTLRQTVRHLNSDCEECLPTSNASINESSVWFRRQRMPEMVSNCRDVDHNSRYVLLMKCMSELDCEHLELIGVEQQIQSLSLKCRTIRENIISKTNSIHSLINEMFENPKQTAQKQTQTQTESEIRRKYESKPNPYQKPKIDDLFSSPTVSVVSEPKNDNLTESQLKLNSNTTEFTELSERTKKLLNGLPALVKGYLTRRLMKTEKVIEKIETIRETTQLLTTYRNSSNKKITIEDINFHKRLIIQLENSCHEFYDIFFSYPKSAQMALICRSREHILDRHYRTGSVLSNYSYLSSNLNSSHSQTNVTKTMSSVTKRVIERKTQKSGTNGSQLDSSLTNPMLKTFSSTQTPKHFSSSPSAVRPSKGVTIRRSQRHNVKNSSLKRKATFTKK